MEITVDHITDMLPNDNQYEHSSNENKKEILRK